MRKKLTVEEIRNAKLPLEMWFDESRRVIIKIKDKICCIEDYRLSGKFYGFTIYSIDFVSRNYEVEAKERILHRWKLENTDRIWETTEYYDEEGSGKNCQPYFVNWDKLKKEKIGGPHIIEEK